MRQGHQGMAKLKRCSRGLEAGWGSLPVPIMEAEKPCGSWGHGVQRQHDAGDFVYPGSGRGVPSSKRARSILFMVR